MVNNSQTKIQVDELNGDSAEECITHLFCKGWVDDKEFISACNKYMKEMYEWTVVLGSVKQTMARCTRNFNRNQKTLTFTKVQKKGAFKVTFAEVLKRY